MPDTTYSCIKISQSIAERMVNEGHEAYEDTGVSGDYYALASEGVNAGLTSNEYTNVDITPTTNARTWPVRRNKRLFM